MAASPTGSSSSSSSSSAPNASAAAAAEATDGPVFSVVSKRLRALRKKYNRILQMQESLAAGKTLNREQEEVLRSKHVVTASIGELERLRAPLAAALAKEMSSRPAPAPAAAASSSSSDGSDSSIQDLISLVYFGSLFDVKLQSEFVATMVARTHERCCCITYDYVTDDAADLLLETDLDAVSALAALAASRPAAAVGVSHRDALQACAHHARLWLRRADEPIYPDSGITYAGVRAKLDRIMASDYYTAQPEMRATVDVAAAMGSYGAGGVPMASDYYTAQESMVLSPEASAVKESMAVEGHKALSHDREYSEEELEEFLSEWVSNPDSPLPANIHHVDLYAKSSFEDLASFAKNGVAYFLLKLNILPNGNINRTMGDKSNHRHWSGTTTYGSKKIYRRVFKYRDGSTYNKKYRMLELTLKNGPRDRAICRVSGFPEEKSGIMVFSAAPPPAAVEEPMAFAGREDVYTLLNEKMKGRNKMDYKGKSEQMMEHIEKLRACIKFLLEREDANLAEIGELSGLLEAAKNDLLKEVEGLRSELQLVQEDHDNRSAQVDSLLTELGTYKEMAGKSAMELDNAMTRTTALEESCSSQRETIKTLEIKLAAANEKLKRSDLTAMETMTEYENQKRMLAGLQSHLEEAEQQILDGEKLRKKLHNTILVTSLFLNFHNFNVVCATSKTIPLQELKGNIRVFCRVRPLLSNESGAVTYPKSGENLGRGIELMHNAQAYSFTFDKVFDHLASQEDVFIEISQLVQSALDGYKVCIFAYGQTGSGKTYTMMGNPELDDHKGMIPRSLEQIFQASQVLNSQGWKYKMQASMLEIYNETIRDLLATNRVASQDGGSKYSIKHDANGNTHVSDLTIVDVTSISEVSSLLRRAAQSRLHSYSFQICTVDIYPSE